MRKTTRYSLVGTLLLIAAFVVVAGFAYRKASHDWKVDQVESLLPKGTHLYCEDKGELWLPRYDGQMLLCVASDAPSKRKR